MPEGLALEPVLFSLLGLVVLANLLLIALIPLRARRQRRAALVEASPRSAGRQDLHGLPSRPDGPADTRTAALGRRGARSDEDARAAAAIEAFVAEVAPDAGGRTHPPAAIETIRALAGPADWPPPSRAVVTEPAAPAGMAGSADWERTLREEAARVARFGRPVTVVIAEVPDLDGVAARLGGGVADRVVTETARLLVTKGRAADRIAWLGEARFGVLLAETEELRASGYADRIRAAVDGWLASAGLSARLSLGWASPTEGLDVLAAASAAQERMRETRRGAPSSSRRRASSGATPV